MITDEIPEVPETVQLSSQCLLSKWGFGDGDNLNWIKDFVEVDAHAVLTELVRRRLLPALDQTVEIETIETIHNPCRARLVDGVDVTRWHFAGDCPIKLTPEWVIVPGSEVLALARELASRDA